MSTLLLRLAAPMQSWGVTSKFETRQTERAPTKSGVLGMIASSLGRKRNESISDLQSLRFGVRTDREGDLLRDYHTAKPANPKKSPYVTNRYYLSDAVFLVGLEGDIALLQQLDNALQNPMFPLYLGRRSCPPEGKISLGIREDKALYEALSEEPLLSKAPPKQTSCRITIDAGDKNKSVYMLRDLPISFDFTNRQFGIRRVYEAPPINIKNEDDQIFPVETTHDPLLELEE